MKVTEMIERNFKYYSPSPEQIVLYQNLRDVAKAFAELINGSCPDSREKSVAITKLEETVMWANASIARKVATDGTKES